MSPFDSSPQTSHSNSNNSTSPSGGVGGGGGDVLLKWGQKKRSRVSRTLNIEDSSSSIHTNQRKNFSAKFSSTSMPPPPPLVSSSSTISNGRVRKHNNPRNLEDLSEHSRMNQIVSRSAEQKLSNSSCMERSNKRMPSTKCNKKQNGTSTTKTSNHVDTNGEKVSVEVIQLPKIYIALSRKEKEDDFLAMKGTKIPQRPKKRAKNIDRNLQYCFPGMWLSDLTKSRYEVREKKSVKKQKCSRGLKGMESLESDSE
ncbi:hypothetical protein TSUD_153960 [Trifolium subterraneum]|uniref:DUF1639 domain-containing protein n=1 Tax=Trifolium subterraneum TaxID=3900 RepID=A0A2Z6N632_TRISU|nr:hypothetical protein TSUD_153960 [Trifolium subterraneum]